MGIDVNTEQLLSLTEATKVMPRVNGKRPAISTLWRWCRKGINGVHLEYLRLGRNILTTEAALFRFFAALAAADRPLTPPAPFVPSWAGRPRPATEAQRQRSLEEADRILREIGI